MRSFDDAVALAQRGREERADAGLEEDLAITVLDEHRAARERDPVPLVHTRPALPQRPGRVAEHRAAVEHLCVAGDGPETLAHGVS